MIGFHSHHIFSSMQSTVRCVALWCLLSAFLIPLTSHVLGQAHPTVASTVSGAQNLRRSIQLAYLLGSLDVELALP